MDEVMPGLWIGDLPSALNHNDLKANNIYSVLSAMRGRVTVHETFIRHQVMLDDTEDADVLCHLIPSITFIEDEMGKGRGVLVHCHAGQSRSAAIVAAYLMYSQNLDLDAAMEMIRKARPSVCPNEGFMAQLELFQKASFKISRQDKLIRMYYMERAVDEVMNGDGSLPATDMFAKFPHTPTDSTSGTPAPRRRIRCRMCRQELATREHMLDHGQLGPPTQPPSRRSSAVHSRPQSSSRNSKPRSRTTSSGTGSRPRRPSALGLNEVAGIGRIGESLSMSALETEEAPDASSDESEVEERSNVRMRRQSFSCTTGMSHGNAKEKSTSRPRPPQLLLEAATLLGHQLSDAISASPNQDHDPAPPPLVETYSTADINERSRSPSKEYISPSDLTAHLFANPNLAALRSPGGIHDVSPPILVNPQCSGYFVEPMKWMEPFLEDGQLAGKILCPNAKCGAKLGNYDWAGVCCGCKEWVTPGFCISRSKVDEVV